MKVKVSYRVSVKVPGKTTSLWLPLPSDTDYQKVISSHYHGTYSEAGIFAETVYGVSALHARWSEPAVAKEITLSIDADIRARHADLGLDGVNEELPESVRVFLEPTAHIPTDGIVKQYADKITNGATNAVAKVRAIYGWTIENTRRDSSTALCGLGDVKSMLEGGQLCGKCVDINSLFVALARAVGIPAREVYGIRVADSELAKPLGKSGDISTAQHCKSEVYLSGYGWVSVDPADVAKALEEKLSADEVQKIRTYLFGSCEANWLAFNHGRDFMLNRPQSGLPLNYFMYPYCEVDGKRISADGLRFTYEIMSIVQNG
jgi:transglutaminase-like putative cysteine protease